MLDDVSKRIREQRLAHSWSVAEMGRQLHRAARAAGDNALPPTAVLASYVRRWEAGKVGLTERYRLYYCAAFSIAPAELAPQEARDEAPGQISAADGKILSGDQVQHDDLPLPAQALADQISELVTWTEATNVGDGTIGYLQDATLRLARDCLTAPPAHSHERAAALAQRVFILLRGGHQRLHQTRDLYVIAGQLCAVLSWISSDIGELTAAESHSHNGWNLAEQADHDGLRALLLSTQSKNSFWTGHYGDAAAYARRGYEFNPPGTVRILLACQEADALQKQGRVSDALNALARAQKARESMNSADELGGFFACGTARQANYTIATYLRDRSVEAALQQAEYAEAAWRAGEDWAFGTWAQVQIGAAIAHALNKEAEGAAAVLQPVLTQPAERQLATLATRLNNELYPLLTDSRGLPAGAAISLREQIVEYCSFKPAINSLSAGGQ